MTCAVCGCTHFGDHRICDDCIRDLAGIGFIRKSDDDGFDADELGLDPEEEYDA